MQAKTTLFPTPPYNFELSFSFLGPSCPDPIAQFDGTTYQRIWPLEADRSVFISLKSIGTLRDPRLQLKIEGESLNNTDVEYTKKHVEEILCLKLDLEAFYEAIREDSTLYQHCLNNIGMKPVLEPDLFEALTWAIIGQQVNLRFACQVKRGMLERFAKHRNVSRSVFYQYPGPAELAGLDADSWRRFKCSRRKAEYIIGLAEQIQNGFNLEELKSLSDEEIAVKLMQIRGIGRWTAEYVLIQGFGRWDALPGGDAGLLNGVKKVYGLNNKPTLNEIVSMAEKWRPYRGLATYYLWWGK